MSRLKFSFQPTEPGSLASPKPVWLRASQTPNAAPAGSAAIAARPTSSTSMGGASIFPPAAVILPAVSSALSEAR